MALLFVSMAMPGCLSLVLGREMMEDARGPSTISNVATSYDLSHTFIFNPSDTNPIQNLTKQKTEQIPIDRTVQNIIINFQTTMNWENVIPDDVDERQVHVRLLWCDENGANCDDDKPIYEVLANNGSYPQTRTDLDRNLNWFDSGLWELTVEGRGVGWNTGVSAVDSQDSWSLRITVIRPCLIFPESPEKCTATIEFE